MRFPEKFAVLFLIILFLWLRFFNLSESFRFTGDPGRDMLVLWDWRETGKPPLLGPQTSALPINQSAIYFYFLYPAFLISNGNPLSANVTVAVFWIIMFVAILWALRNRAELQRVALVVLFLSAIHPLFVEQTRMVWNPSFLPPLLATSLIAFFLLIEKYSRTRLWIFSFSTALAVSLHFPVGALALACVLYLAIFNKEQLGKVIPVIVVSLVFINLPTIVFEARHGFLITKSVLQGGWIGLTQFTRWENFRRLIDFTGGLPYLWMSSVLLFGAVSFAVWKTTRQKRSLAETIGFLLVMTAGLTIISGLAFHSHYAFGTAILLFFLISQLPTKIRIVILIILAVVWLNPRQINTYIAPAGRTLEEEMACFANFCSKEKETVFVSAQYGESPFHVGYEYRYLMKQAGCDVKYIESQPEKAEKMAVVVDGSTYEHGKTSYYELTLFGQSEEAGKYECGNELDVIILKKNN